MPAASETTSLDKVQNRLRDAGFDRGLPTQDQRMLDVGRAVYTTVLGEVDSHLYQAVQTLQTQVATHMEEMVLEAGRAVGDELRQELLGLVEQRLQEFMAKIIEVLSIQQPPAPVVQISVPKQAPPVVQVSVPKRTVKKVFEYDEMGKPTAVVEQEM